ncbi:VOC family protein [Salinactinospora qingdaonensis]|uniref:VOC domain-containing protein n=1 Tax=Salinactinospora qingdaonensis TaxID=702744 RepID=A0ABP7FAQ8_9ACTN
MPRLDGSTHVNLTVTDLERSTEWYRRVFGLVLVNDVTPPESGFRFCTLLHPQSFASIVLGQAQTLSSDSDRFDEHRVGLHHLGYHVPEREDLDVWVRHLDEQGVEHSGVTESGHEAGAQVWFHDPDGIWLEVYWVNRAFFADRLRQRWREAKRQGRTGEWVTPTAQ